MDDRDRKTILARRRFFIATAVAGLAATQCENPFRPCLKVAMPVVDASASPPPETDVPEAAATVVDASSDAMADANQPDSRSTKRPLVPGPKVCLNPYE
jgi:hypothetical protein